MRAWSRVAARMGCATLVFASPILAQEQECSDLEQLLTGLVTSARDAGHIGAAAFVVCGQGTVLCQRGFGSENAETNEPVDPETSLFFAASIGKLFVATAAAQLAEEGRLDLTAPLTDCVTCADAGAHSVSVEALLTHVSGIEERLLGCLLPPGDAEPDLDQFFAHHPPRFVRPSGLAIRYSNLGVALAGLAVERVSELSFRDYAERRIFAPLAMHHSTFRQRLPDELARHLVSDGRGSPPRLGPYPAGSLAATPADMARFLLAHLGDGATDDGRILSVASARDMCRRRFGAHALMPGVALGFFESFVNGRRALFHTGDRGHHSILWFLPEERVGFYLVYDASDDMSGDFRQRFTQAFADQLVPATPFTLPSPIGGAAEHEERLAGFYRFEPGSPHTVEALGIAARELRIGYSAPGEWMAQLGFGGLRLRLIEVAPGLCRSEDGAYLAFSGNENGLAARVDVSGGISDPFGAERIEFYERGPLHLGVLLATLALFLLRALWTPMAAVLGQGATAPQASGPCSRAWRVSGWTSALVLMMPMLVLAWLFSDPFPMTAIPWILPAETSLLLVAAALAVFQSALAVNAWRRRDGSLARRVWLGLAMLGVLATLPVLAYWNLLGYRF